MIGEVRLVRPALRGVGPEQNDVEWLDAIAVQPPFGAFDVVRTDFIAGPLWVRSSTTPSP
jgi:hypothetical protein